MYIRLKANTNTLSVYSHSDTKTQTRKHPLVVLADRRRTTFTHSTQPPPSPNTPRDPHKVTRHEPHTY